METYRIVCRFEPGHKRLAGQIAGTKTRKTQRGAWRVLHAYAVSTDGPYCVVKKSRPPNRHVGILTARPQRVGTLCDPFKLLKEWQAARRAQA